MNSYKIIYKTGGGNYKIKVKGNNNNKRPQGKQIQNNYKNGK